jgi:ABC-type transport system substrate-binding protein
MTARKFLIFAPSLVSLLLLISFFWVPTYDEQTKGNPDRLVQFVTASSGDAAMLNPILSADSASSQINGMVFEGLIDRDENLAFRGRVARSWKIYEEAYFYVNERAATARWGKVETPQLATFLRKELLSEAPSWQHIRSVDLIPAEEAVRTVWIDDGGQKKAISLEIDAPPRIHIVMDRVDPLLFERLADFFGDDYFTTFDPSAHVTAELVLPPDLKILKAKEVMPTTVHHPILEFTLREGVRFHDGHEVTAEDVKFTYEAIMDPRNLSPRVSDYEPVESVEAVDAKKVRITYKRLYSPAFATWGMGILPAHLLNDEVLTKEALALGKDPEEFTMRQSRFGRDPVGCGPFVFQEWKSDQYIRLKRFEAYWDGPPNYKEYVMRVIPDPLTQEMEFYAGTIDDYSVQPHQVERLRKDEQFQDFSGTSFGYTYIGYNLRKEPFNDVRVRRALGMAIDTKKIIKFLLYGQGESITGPFAKQTDYYNHDLKPLPYDPEGAIALLEKSGWEKGNDGVLQKNGKRLAFTLITNNGNPLRKAVLAIAQDAWRKIGIQVETDLLEWSVFIQKRVNQLDFDALILGWSMGIDPDLYQIWHSSQSGPYQLNFVGFSDAEADDLIIKIRQEYDHVHQISYCHQLHEIIAREQPYTFLYVGRWTALLDKRIVRSIPGADGQTTIRPIVPTKTGGYTYHFNQWIKLNGPPEFSAEG